MVGVILCTSIAIYNRIYFSLYSADAPAGAVNLLRLFIKKVLVVVLDVFELFFSEAISVAINIKNITIVGFHGFRKIATEIEKKHSKKKNTRKKTVGETK
jgi:hypothetical protein